MHTDTIMKDIWLCLARDFRRGLGSEDFLKEQETYVQNIERDAQSFRRVEFPGVMQASVWLHKTVYQMQNLFKRYIFSTDVRPAILGKNSIEEFVDFQSTLTGPRMSLSNHLVLQEARKIVKEILGPYDANEHAVLCQYGSRANRFIPRASSYLDVKVSNPSGSTGHIKWFKDHLVGDHLLARATKVSLVGKVHVKCQPYDVCADLAVTAVAKSWKAARIILPNSVLGAFHSYGLGLMMMKRLRVYKDRGRYRLDISKLQHIHGKLARRASRSKKFVTVDMKRASDSYTYELVARLVPYQWMKQLKLGRISDVSIGKRRVKLNSFMAMGIGYTFPLQTLLFYALIKATQNLLGLDYRISVYGDDLIYHRSIHKYVVHVFTNCGLKVNPDKSFVDHDFRESCGHDYYKGVDVRPFQPEFVGRELKGRKLSAFLYKTINGLTRRWSLEEIPETYWYLLKTIQRNDGLIYQIPPSFPDYSGVKVTEPQISWFYVPWSPVVYDLESQAFQFRHLKELPGDRVVLSMDAYYWSWHRSQNLREDKGLPYIPLGMNLDELFAVGWKPDHDDRQPSAIKWKKLTPRKVIRSTLSGRRYRKKVPTVSDKQITSFRSSLQTISVWF